MKTYRGSNQTTVLDLGKRCHKITGETSIQPISVNKNAHFRNLCAQGAARAIFRYGRERPTPADGNGRGTQASSSVRQKLKKCILSYNEKRAFAKEIRRAMKTYRASGQTTWISGSAVTGLQEKRRQPISVSGNAHFRNLCERFQMQRRYS